MQSKMLWCGNTRKIKKNLKVWLHHVAIKYGIRKYKEELPYFITFYHVTISDILSKRSKMAYNQSMSEHLHINHIITEVWIDRCSLPRKTSSRLFFRQPQKFSSPIPSQLYNIFLVLHTRLWAAVCASCAPFSAHTLTHSSLSGLLWIRWWFLECSLYHFVLMFRLSSFHMCKIKSPPSQTLVDSLSIA